MNQAAGDFPLMAGDIALNLRRDAQLLLQLADKRLRLAFAGFHFAAGKLPHSRLIGVGRALRQQNFAILFNNGGYNIKRF
jgi:hypothetical protein